MSIERFNYILSEIYKTNKFMPTLADILQVHRQIPYTTQKEKTKIKGNCLKCDNTGYVSYFKQIDGRQYIFGAVCDCGRQERFDGRQVSDPKNKSDYYMPTIEELGLEIKTTRPSDSEIIKSMNMLKNSNIVSEEIKNIIMTLDDKQIGSVMRYFKTNYNGQVDMKLIGEVLKTING